MNNEIKEDERGKAGIIVTLEDSTITVKHIDDGTVLFEKHAYAGDWDRLWDAIKN